MSSHHIIREKQEPALLIMNLDGFSSENLGQLLEWSPTVITNGQIYEETDSLGIKIDAVITPDADFVLQTNTKIVSSENNILQDGLTYLTAEGYPAVNIIANQFTLQDYMLFVDLIDLVIYVQNKKIYPVRSGFNKWITANETIKLFCDAVNLNYTGLTKISDNHYQTQKDGFISLTFEQPFIFIAEQI